MRTIPACAIIRNSDRKQEKNSPEDQREFCEWLTDQGHPNHESPDYGCKFSIEGWYEDISISGDHTEKRGSFNRMVADCAAGSYEAILCWDQDRFGRFDMIEAGHLIHPLRKKGVYLVDRYGVTD